MAAVSQLDVPSFDELTARFNYDRTRVRVIREERLENRDGAVIQDIHYDSLCGGQIAAYWISPEGVQSFPVVIYLHPAPGSRGTYLEEAVAFARQGVGSLLIEAPWAQMKTFGPLMAEPHSALEAITLFIKDIRRSIDLVSGEMGASAGKLGLVGHSLGSYVGGVLAGVEKRLRAAVLIAGTGSLADVAAANMPDMEAKLMDQYRLVIAPLDPVYFVSRASPTALFFQLGSQDSIMPREKSEAFADLGSQPKRVTWYETDHFFEDESARRDRMAWLSEKLKG